MAARSRTVLRNTLWGGLNAFVELILPTVTSVLVARAMGPTRLGAYVHVTWVSIIGAGIGGFGIPIAARKYLTDFAGSRRPDAVLALVRVATAVQAILALAIIGILEGWVLLALPPEDHGFATLAVLSVLPYQLTGMATAMNEAREDQGSNAIPSMIGGITNAVGIGLTLVLHWELTGLAGALLVSRCVDAGLRWLTALRKLPKFLAHIAPMAPTPPTAPFQRGFTREIVHFCALQSVLLLVALVVANRSEILFLKWFRDLREVAFYSVSFGFAQMVSQIAAPFSMAATMSLFVVSGRSRENAQRFAEVYYRYVALIVLPAAWGLAALSGPLVRVLYGPEYWDAAPVLMVAAVLSVAGPLAAPATALATSSGRLSLLVRAGLFAVVVTLCLDTVFVRYWGAVGGAAANGVGQLASTVMVWALAARAFRVRIPASFTLRLAGATFAMAMIVAVFASLVSDPVALVAGPILGAGAWMSLLNLARVLSPEDRDRVLEAGRLLPVWTQSGFRRVVEMAIVREHAKP